MGAKKRPFYRVVVTDQRNARDGRFIENIGKYHPLNEPSFIEIDEERALAWLAQGAQPSDAVRVLMVHSGVWEKFEKTKPAGRLETPRAATRAKAKASAPAAKAAPAKASPALTEPALTEPAPVEPAPTESVEPAEKAEASS